MYHLLLLPIGVLTFTVAFTFWVLGASLLFLPVYAWALPEPVHAFDSWVKITLDAPPNLDLVGGGRGWVIDTPIEYAALVLIGAAVLLLTPWVVRGLATANRYLVRGLLGSDVFARVQTLTDSRAAAVDQAAEDRRRSSATCTTGCSSVSSRWRWTWGGRRRSSIPTPFRRRSSSTRRTRRPSGQCGCAT